MTKYTDHLLAGLPPDDTEPNKFNNKPKPCRVCLKQFGRDQAVKTTNRDLFELSPKAWIDSVCAHHYQDTDYDQKVRKLLEYDGIDFIIDALYAGVITPEHVFNYSEGVYQEVLESETFDKDELPNDITVPPAPHQK